MMFDRVYCVTLARRPDRWDQFLKGLPADWPFPQPIRFNAIDGSLCKPPPPPAWGNQGAGAWGCWRSHLSILETCINEGVESVLLLEDDALFVEDFTPLVKSFLSELPPWDVVYLGGQHLFVKQHPPVQVSSHVWQPHNVNRTHAWAIHRRGMLKVYHHLLQRPVFKAHHIDHHMGRLVSQGRVAAFSPKEWLVGQRGGQSDIARQQDFPDRIWAGSESVGVPQSPFVAVVGTHSSGSSLVAGMLHTLGIHMGNRLGGYWDRKAGGFEAQGLAQLCEWAVPFPATSLQHPAGQVWARLKNWISSRRREAHNRQTLAGGKYPQLAFLGQQLMNVCNESLRLVVCDRPLDESIASLIRRMPDKCKIKIGTHQRALHKALTDLQSQVPVHHQLTISHEQMLDSPVEQAHRLLEFIPEFTPVSNWEAPVEALVQ